MKTEFENLKQQCATNLSKVRLTQSELDIPEGYPMDAHNVQASKQVARSIAHFEAQQQSYQTILNTLEELESLMALHNAVFGKEFNVNKLQK